MSLEESAAVAELEFSKYFVLDELTKRKLLRVFVKSFKRGYAEAVANLQKIDINTRASISKSAKLTPLYPPADEKIITTILINIDNGKEQVKQFDGWNIQGVEYLGEGVGLFMGVIEFGLTSLQCKSITPADQTKIYDAAIDFGQSVNKIEHIPKKSFLTRRIKRMAKMSAGLSDQQINLILKIANLFK